MKIAKFIIITIILVFLSCFAFYSHSINKKLDKNGQNHLFTIEQGEGVKKIAANLEKNNLIDSAFWFETYVWRQGVEAKFQAGDYELSPKMNIKEIVALMTKGKSLSKEADVRVIEGWTNKDYSIYLGKNGFDQDKFFSLASTRIDQWNLPFQKPEFLSGAAAGVDLEGYLFPDTYRVFKDADESELIKKMLLNLDSKLTPELKNEIAKQGRSIHEIFTMASIIEKEVNREEDRKIVAGVLYKRMENGMRLQVDSSINYITGGKNPQATHEELEISSPYNTYRNDGLPPGPICNPGMSAILAAIYPKDSDYWFYLNRLDTGETIFSRNYDEHLANKRRYLD